MGNTFTEAASFEGSVAPAAAPSKSTAKKFDITRFRSASTGQQGETSSAVSFTQSQFPVRKPGGKSFFRAHPDEDFYLYGAPVLEDSERNVHILDPDFQVPQDISRFVSYVNLSTCITHKGSIFVWHFKESANDWSKSAKSVLRKARSEWVRIKPNLDMNCYMTERAPDELASVQPKWPSLTFEQILESAFDGRVVKDANNPVVRELQGKA